MRGQYEAVDMVAFQCVGVFSPACLAERVEHLHVERAGLLLVVASCLFSTAL